MTEHQPNEDRRKDDEDFVIEGLGFTEDPGDGGDFFDADAAAGDDDFDELVLEDGDDDFAIELENLGSEEHSSGMDGDEADQLFQPTGSPERVSETFGEEPQEFQEFGGTDWGGQDFDLADASMAEGATGDDDGFGFDDVFAQDREDAFAEPEELEVVSAGDDEDDEPESWFDEEVRFSHERRVDGAYDEIVGGADAEADAEPAAEEGLDSEFAAFDAELEQMDVEGLAPVEEPTPSPEWEDLQDPLGAAAENPWGDFVEDDESSDAVAHEEEPFSAAPLDEDLAGTVAPTAASQGPEEVDSTAFATDGEPELDEVDKLDESAFAAELDSLGADGLGQDLAEVQAEPGESTPYAEASASEAPDDWVDDVDPFAPEAEAAAPVDGGEFGTEAFVIEDQLSEQELMEAAEESQASGEAPLDPADAGMDLSSFLPGPQLDGDGWEEMPLGESAVGASVEGDAAHAEDGGFFDAGSEGEEVDPEWAPVAAEGELDDDDAFAGAGEAEDDPIYGAQPQEEFYEEDAPDFSDYEDEYVDVAAPQQGVAVLAPRRRRLGAWLGGIAALALVGFSGVLLARPDLIGLQVQQATTVDRVSIARPRVDLGVQPPAIRLAGDPTAVDPLAVVDPATDPTATDPNVADPSTTDPNAGDPTAVDPLVAVVDPPTDPGTDPAATDPNVVDPSTTDPNAGDPTAVDPLVAVVDPPIDPVTDPGTDPVATDPNVADPSTTDPNAGDPAAVDPLVAVVDLPTDPATDRGTDPAAGPGSDPVATDPNVADPSTTDPNAGDPAAVDPLVAVVDPPTDPATDPGTDPVAGPGADPVATDPNVADPSTTDPNAGDPTAVDPVAVGGPTGPANPVAVGDPKQGAREGDDRAFGAEPGAQALGSDAVIAPFDGEGPERFSGVDVRLINGSKAFAQLHNGNYFVGTVKSARPAYITLTMDEGEVSLHRDDLVVLTPLASADYKELKMAEDGFVRLSNNNRLRGTVMEALQGDHVILETRSNRILIPRTEIEEIGAEDAAPVKFDAGESDAWLLRMIEEEMRRQEQQVDQSQSKPSVKVPVGEPAQPGKD